MLRPELYIHSAGYIAPVAIPDEAVTRLSAQEPDYRGIIPPIQLRRMSKAVRMGIGAARTCLDRAGIQTPDAIAVGTTMGCLRDTEAFLKKMVIGAERLLTPTSFIQSTHNTVAGQIALHTGCHGYNTTVSQGGHSFEGAVLSGALYLAEHPEHSVLCGGVDELTDTSFALMQRAGVYTRRPYAPEDLARTIGSRPVGGEGAGFLWLNKRPEGAKAHISGLHLFRERDAATALALIRNCLKEGGATSSHTLWSGITGDVQHVAVYMALLAEWGNHVLPFKQRTGEWGTVIATALCRAVLEWPQDTQRIWVINHYGPDWSVWLLEQ